MATYMYTSATGSNWDDDDKDFDPSVYAGADAQFQAANRLANARLALQQSQSVIEGEQESTHSSATTATQLQVDYGIDPDNYPTYAEHMTECWFSDDNRRPAYAALSCEFGFIYPDRRRKYSANWKVTKLRMGGNMKNTMMMMPSPLRLSKTWPTDNTGEYTEESDYMQVSPSFSTPRLPTPLLSYGSESDEERDEAQTSPGSPSMVQTNECKVEIEEVSSIVEKHRDSNTNAEKYDPTTGAIDLPAHNIKAMEAEMAREFANFSSIAEDLAVHHILGDAEESMLDKDVDEAACRVLVSIKKAQPTLALTTVTAGAIQITSPFTEASTTVAAAAYNHLSHSKDNAITVPAESASLIKASIVASHRPSPDLKYIQDPTSTSLVWSTVAAGWFALSSLPWGRIVVAAAGVLVDVAALVARR